MPSTTTRAALRFPLLTDIADVPQWMNELASDVDSVLIIWSTGTTAVRTASSRNGRAYYATDGDRLSYDMGTSWRQIMMVDASGNMVSDNAVNAPSYKVSGVALAASNLSNGVTGSGSVVLSVSPTLTGTPLAPTPTTGDSSTKIATTAFVAASIAASTPTFNRQVASYTAVLADSGRVTEMNLAGANTFTIPNNASVPYPIGTSLYIAQYGAGQTTIAGAAGVTIDAINTARKIAGQFGMAQALKVGTDEWYLTGSITP